MSERMTFEQACQALGISETELEQLVSAGEIASVKDGDTLFFTPDAVERYKASRGDEATILLADDEINLLDDDVDEIDLLGGDESGGTTSVLPAADEGTAELDLGSGDETILSLDEVLEDDSEGTTPIPSVSEGGLGDDTLLDTELLDLSDDADTFDVDTAEDLTLDDITEQGTLLRGGGARVMQMKRKRSHAVWTILMAASVFMLLLPLAVTMQTFYNSAPANAEMGPTSQKWVKDFNLGRETVEWTADLFAKRNRR